MAKDKTVFVCTNCGQESPKWIGKCPSCGQWNTFSEEVVRKETPVAKHVAHGIESIRSKPQYLREIVSSDEQRINLMDDELNRVLGGGLVQGSLTLLGGEPGIGKSTPRSADSTASDRQKNTVYLRRRECATAQTTCRQNKA